MRGCLFIALILWHITGFAQLKANFSSSVTGGCSPLFVQFKDSSVGSPTSWQWDFGNGNGSNAENPGAIFSKPGTYTVKLLVNNGNVKDSVAKTAYITIYANPQVDFQVNPPSGCVPVNVQFTDKTTNDSVKLAKWTWDFGDGQSDTVQNPMHTYTTVGSFSIILKVSNSKGCFSYLQKQSVVNTNGVTNPGFDYSFTNACTAPVVVTFKNVTPGGDSINYVWNFGDGSPTVTDPNPVYTYKANGDYTIELIASTTSGCQDTVTKLISIGTVSPDFLLPSNACTKTFIAFSDGSVPKPVAATWDFGDGFMATGENVGHIYGAAGSYPVKLVAIFGACKDSVTKFINVTDKPKAQFTSTGNPKSCTLPGIVQFQNTSINATRIKWNFGDGTTSIQHNPLHTYKDTGIFTVTLIAINSSGCSDTLVAKNYVILGPPVISALNKASYYACVRDSINFGAKIISGDTIINYSWSFGDGGGIVLGKTPKNAFALPGKYTITLKVVTANGCSDSSSFPNVVTIGDKPQANFQASPLGGCGSVPIQFTDESSGAPVDSWIWDFGDGGTSRKPNPIYKYTDTGSFSVTLIVRSNGCSDTLQFENYIYINAAIANFAIKYQCTQKLAVNFQNKSVDASSYYWDFGDGQFDTNPNPLPHLYSSSGTYLVKLIVSNGSCVDSTSQNITVISQKPNFIYSPAKTTICKYDTAQFIAKNYDSLSVNSLFWDFGDGVNGVFNPSIPSATHQYNTAGTYFPLLVVKENNGCIDTITEAGFKITVIGPTASFVNTNNTCASSDIIFTDKSFTDSSHPITNWVWDFGDKKTVSFNVPPFTHQYDTSGYFKVKLKVIDNSGCFDSVVAYKSITTKPVAGFILPDSIKCVGSIVNFANLSTGIFLTYSWSFGDGDSSSAASPTHQYLYEGFYTVSLGITDEYGCKDSVLKNSYIGIHNPMAQFTIDDTVGLCPPLEINPVNSSQYSSFLTWDFGDGNTSNIPNPVHYYLNAGTYNLQLIAQGHGSCYDTIHKTIMLHGPYGALSYSPPTLCNYGTVNFNLVGKNILKYNWDFNDGIADTSSSTARSHFYATPGLYVPRVIIRDSAGCNVTVQNLADTIRVIGITGGFTAQAGAYCDSALILFKDETVLLYDNLGSRTWNFGDNTTSPLVNPTHYFYQSGTAIVTLNIVSAFGCAITDTLPVQVNVHQSPIINANIPPQACINATVNFTATNNSVPPGAIKWFWQFGNGDSSSEQNPVYTFTQTNTLNVIVTAINEFGCKDTVNNAIVVNPLPVLAVNAGLDSTVCRGQRIMLQPSGAIAYTWAQSPTLSCVNCPNPLASPDSTAWYYVAGTSQVGCKNRDSIKITVTQPFKLVVPLQDTVCLGFSVQLTASGANVYNWQPTNGLSNPNIANPVVSPAVTTTYTLIGADTKKCFFDTASVIVNVFPNPTVKLLDTAVTILAGSSYVLSPTASYDVIKWQWLPPAGISCTNCAQPILSPGQTTRYQVKVFNPYGCFSADYVTVQVLCNNYNLYIPNTFSPNSNTSNNRYFYPRGTGLFTIKSMRIFNRWGQPVFEKLNFTPNDIGSAWDGKYNGQLLPTDVYVYIIEVICSNNTIITSKGDVTLLR